MRTFGNQGFRLIMAVLLVGMSTSSAYAYLDAGTGSMILQVILGGVAGLAIAGKLYWYKFLSLIGVKREPVEARQVARDADADAHGGH